MIKITLEQLGDILNEYRQDVRRAVVHAQPMNVTKDKIEAAKETLKQKLDVFSIVDHIDFQEGEGLGIS